MDARLGRKILRQFHGSGNKKWFTLRRGYATTLLQVQGSTLVSIWAQIRIMPLLALRRFLQRQQWARAIREQSEIVGAELNWEQILDTYQERHVAAWLRNCADRCSTCESLRCKFLMVTKSMQHAKPCLCQQPEQVKASVPKSSDVPHELRNLSHAATLALRILVSHQGTPQRHRSGYHRMDQLSHLSWAEESVTARISALDADDRVKTQRAYEWLTEHSSTYVARNGA